MATGNQVLPGAPVTAEHTDTGRPAAAEQARWPGQAFQAGQLTTQEAPGGQPLPGQYAVGGGMVVSGYAALFPPPARVALPASASLATDRAGGKIQPARIHMSYSMTVVRHGGTWLVRSISSAATQPWPSP